MCDQGGRGDLMRFAFWHNNSDFSIKKKKKLEGCKHVARRQVSKDSNENR